MDDLTPLLLALLLVSFVWFTFRWATRITLSEKKVFDLYKLDRDEYRLASTDLSNSKHKVKLTTDNAVGEPDALFISNCGKAAVVGEYKHRKFRGVVRYREYYQVMLYIGGALNIKGVRETCGLLRFKDGLVKITFNQNLFYMLESAAIELKRTSKSWKPVNKKPLHKRKGFPVNRVPFKLVVN